MTQLSYVHARKTGGTSIIDFFKEIGVKISVFSSLKNVPDDTFIFASVRNPYERAVSGWKYCSSTKYKTLAVALKYPPKKTDIPKEYWLSVGHDYRHFTKSQTESYVWESKRIDWLLRAETLADDMKKMCDHLSIDTKSTTIKVLRKGTYEYDLTDLDRELIYERFKNDFINFNYQK